MTNQESILTVAVDISLLRQAHTSAINIAKEYYDDEPMVKSEDVRQLLNALDKLLPKDKKLAEKLKQLSEFKEKLDETETRLRHLADDSGYDVYNTKDKKSQAYFKKIRKVSKKFGAARELIDTTSLPLRQGLISRPGVIFNKLRKLQEKIEQAIQELKDQ